MMAQEQHSDDMLDIFIIGGGINGCGIARDAAGRGLKVALAEMGDLAQATSSASTKLFHGGLRYLEYYEFRLVREALIERETLLQAMPHISWPLRFVLPHHKGLRPAWLLRLGLFIYDHLGGRKILPSTRTLDLRTDVTGKPLKPLFKRGFEYSDCWVDDARLVVLNARDAKLRGAQIMTRTKVEQAKRIDGGWCVSLIDTETGAREKKYAKALVNAGGPWVMDLIENALPVKTNEKIRLVRGSHIVVPKLHDHDRCYIFQQSDGRIVFAIPYQEDFTLIGTTDAEHQGTAAEVKCSEEEAAYLCAAASEYFAKPIKDEDIVWTYSGVRPLYDDGASSATAATRDYVLTLDQGAGDEAPVLNIFGGKITTYRRLAESALAKLSALLPASRKAWTAGVALPGGDFHIDALPELINQLLKDHPWLEEKNARRLVRAYGTEAATILSPAVGKDASALGQHFGAGLYEAELAWLVEHEWARSAQDVVWRRSKLGLRLDKPQIEAIEKWMSARCQASETKAIN